MNNGPVTAAIDADQDFLFYKSGIYHSIDEKTWLLKGESKPEWSYVSHAVLIHGWGEEDGMKYWEL